MATNNTRDVRLGVQIETTGQAGLKSLAADFKSLAKEGGDAAPAFQRAADEIDRLAQQAAGLDALKSLAADVERLTDAQTEAAARAKALGDELERQQASTAAARDRQRELRTAVDQADDALAAARNALRELRAETSATEKGTAAYSIELARLVRLQTEADGALRQQQRALRDAGAAAREAGADERAAATAYDRSAEALNRATKALQDRRAAQQQAEADTLALGVAVTDLAAAESQLLEQVQRVVAAGRLQRELTEAQTTADELAAAEARALAEARRRGAEAAEAELLALKDSAQFLAQYTERQRQASAEALRFVEAEEAAAAAADKAARRIAELNATAAQTARAAAYVRDIEQALAAADAEAKQAAESLRKFTVDTASAGRTLNDAFGTTGVRSLQAIENEIRQVDAAVSKLQREFGSGAISADDLARATGSAAVRLATLKREMQTIPALPGAFERINSVINDTIGRFGSLTAAIATVGIAIKPILDAEIALERMRRVLTTVTGSAEEAGKQIEFVRQVAQRSGQSFDAAGVSYSKFAASALQVGIATKDVQQVFESVALATGNLGLSSDQATRALEALSQIASKGTVSMEELRQQLGDALPGVLPALAKELGVTDAELNRIVESGNLLAFEAIPAIGRSIRNLGPQAKEGVTGFVAEWERFKNVLRETSTTVTDGALGQAVGNVLSFASASVQRLAFLVALASESFTFLGKAIGVTVASASDGFKGLGAEIDKLKAESEAKLTGLADRITGVGGAATAVTPAVQGLTEAVKAAATEAGATAVAAESSAKSFAALALASQKVIDQADVSAAAAQRMAEARKDEAEAIQTVIGLSQDEGAILKAAAEQQAGYAAALERQAAADVVAADSRRAALQSLVSEAEARGVSTERIRVQVEALQSEITKLDAVAEKSRQAAAAQDAVATAARLSAEAFKDNAGRLDEYRETVEGAERALEGVRRALLRGKATTDDVTKAEKALAVAKRQLNDALDDQIARSERLAESLKVQAELTNALLLLDIERLKVQRDEALVRGADTIARQLDLRIAETELQITKNSTDAKRLEANEIIRSQSIRRAELESRGQLTPAIAAEIDLLIRKAQIQTIEAETTDVATAAEKKRLEGVKNGTEGLEKHTGSTRSNTSATSDGTKGTNDNTKARKANADAISSQADEQARYNELLLRDPSRLVGGNGLAGIGPSQSGAGDFGVRSPSSGTGGNGSGANGTTSDFSEDTNSFNNLYNRTPDGGITRTGGGQYLPPDNSGNWEFDELAWREAGSPILVNNGQFTYWKRKGAGTKLNGTTPSTGSFGPAPAPAPSPSAKPSSAPAPAPATSSAAPTRVVRLEIAGPNGTTSLDAPEDVADALLDAFAASARRA